MKRFIAICFSSAMLFVLASAATRMPVERTKSELVLKSDLVKACSFSVPTEAFVFVQASVLDTAPRFVSFVTVYPVNDAVKSILADVPADNNSPPIYQKTPQNRIRYLTS